jgi:hypothetical protein
MAAHEGLTNAGKKEQRQFDQELDKASRRTATTLTAETACPFFRVASLRAIP